MSPVTRSRAANRSAIVVAVTVSHSKLGIKQKRLFNLMAEEALVLPILVACLHAGSRPFRCSPVPPPGAGVGRGHEGAKRMRHQRMKARLDSTKAPARLSTVKRWRSCSLAPLPVSSPEATYI